MGLRRAFAVVAVLGLAAPAHAEPQEWARGHITVGGPWVRQRSTNVLLYRDSVDGFFYPAPEAPEGMKARVTATVLRNGTCDAPAGCLDFELNINFHQAGITLPTAALPWPAPAGLPPTWISGCEGGRNAPVGCDVPGNAFTGEVAAERGADLDVLVTVEYLAS